MVSPCYLEVLLHYYSSPYPHDNADAPAVREAIAWFFSNGIFEERVNNNGPKVTEKGEAWLKMILATPFPEARWCDPRHPNPGGHDGV